MLFLFQFRHDYFSSYRQIEIEDAHTLSIVRILFFDITSVVCNSQNKKLFIEVSFTVIGKLKRKQLCLLVIIKRSENI